MISLNYWSGKMIQTLFFKQWTTIFSRTLFVSFINFVLLYFIEIEEGEKLIITFTDSMALRQIRSILPNNLRRCYSMHTSDISMKSISGELELFPRIKVGLKYTEISVTQPKLIKSDANTQRLFTYFLSMTDGQFMSQPLAEGIIHKL